METTAVKSRKFNELAQQVQEMIELVLSDFKMRGFIKKYERAKRNKRKMFVVIRKYVNGFIYSFPVYWQMRVKRYTDIVLALCITVLFSPVILATALVIKLTSKGPIFYKQERVGKDGKFFVMYKFRSMHTNAEAGTGPVWAKEHDPRTIAIGHFLRTTHLDELPQLINVFKNEMSIVGPRPERPFFVSQLKREVPGYENRLLVKPGITGLAQVRQRYDETIEDVKKKLRYDVMYIRRMCVVLDIKVLLWTLGVVLGGKVARSHS